MSDDIPKIITYKYINQISLTPTTCDNFKAKYDKIGNHTRLVTRNDIFDFEYGAIVGVFINDVFEKAVVVPLRSDVKFCIFNKLCPENASNAVISLSSVDKAIMKLEDFVDMMTHVITDNIINLNNKKNVIVAQSNLLCETDNTFNGYKCWNIRNNTLSCTNADICVLALSDILGKNMCDIANDNYQKYLVDCKLHEATEIIKQFLETQHTFDNVTKYTNILSTINNNT